VDVEFSEVSVLWMSLVHVSYFNDAAALSSLVKAAKSGNHLAEGYLATPYATGYLLTDQRNANAQYAIGQFCSVGVGSVIKNDGEAIRYYKLEADQGYANAQSKLGFCYASGAGVTKNEAEAVRYYKLAADQGYAATAKFFCTVT
jgi:TPR repeat protein